MKGQPKVLIGITPPCIRRSPLCVSLTASNRQRPICNNRNIPPCQDLKSQAME